MAGAQVEHEPGSLGYELAEIERQAIELGQMSILRRASQLRDRLAERRDHIIFEEVR